MNAAAPSEKDVTSAVQEVVSTLEEEIVLGVLHPRERLIEDELMARFHVKRHVVRQALAEMEQQGLVQRRKNSGAQVRALTAREVMELYALRELLETHCMKLIPLPATPAQLKQLAAIQRSHAAAVKANDPRAVFRANLAFHAALYALSGNETLIEAIAEYARRTHPVRLSTLVSPQSIEAARQDHERIIEALRTGDRKALVQICAAHLRPARDTYLANLNRLGRGKEEAA
ncbi:GntR family transcriptional regulator [Noviherbaspirillum humi]|uniref:GntR family transcriptional regulator n=1 Tax=Noviherbaspirillum humi TaxID=1688639 RepID=UPI001FE7706D|nr:GntR family transcriptional regulator [Noviherbaspirillum humi]